jgi:hypothetical protein
MGDLCEDGVAGGESGLRTALRAHAEILRERASWFEDLATTWYDWREGEGEPVNHAWADGSQSRRDIR